MWSQRKLAWQNGPENIYDPIAAVCLLVFLVFSYLNYRHSLQYLIQKWVTQSHKFATNCWIGEWDCVYMTPVHSFPFFQRLRPESLSLQTTSFHKYEPCAINLLFLATALQSWCCCWRSPLLFIFKQPHYILDLSQYTDKLSELLTCLQPVCVNPHLSPGRHPRDAGRGGSVLTFGHL